jgi:hypothetical protein
MSTTPTPQTPGAPVATVNVPAENVTGAANKLLQTGISAAETAIIAAEPWMGTTVWKQLWEAALSALMNWIAAPIVTWSGQVVISIEEYEALQTAVSAQAALDAAKQTGDQNAISQASQNVDSAILGAIQYIGQSQS